MKIEYSLHNALPQLVVEQDKNGRWIAAIEFDWADSYEGTFFPHMLTDVEGKVDGEFARDWLPAKGAVSELGALACDMEFPARVELGPVPANYVARFSTRSDDGHLAFAHRDNAESWARDGGDFRFVEPNNITEEHVLDACHKSWKESKR